VISPTNQPESTYLAVVHRTGDVWRGLIVEQGNPDRPRIVDAQEFPDDAAESLTSWITDKQASEVLYVLPASTTVCRTCTLPDAAPEVLEQALRLQAEGHLTEIAPPHRLGMAVLPATPGDPHRSGVILAWPETARFEPPQVEIPAGFAPDVGALAALLNGQRSNEPLMWVDHADGSLAIALPHEKGPALRAIREDTGDQSAWSRNVSRALAETALSVGVHAPAVDALSRDANHKVESLNGRQAALFLSPEVMQSAAERVEDVTRSADWWSKYGVAVGAALARNSKLAGLTRMRQAPSDTSSNMLSGTVNTLSQTRTMIWITVACVLVLMFAPLVISLLRTALISIRYPDLDAQVAVVEHVEKQRQLYEELGDEAWPMTKLLADITANTPVGIELDDIKIMGGDSFSVSGKARPEGGLSGPELINQMNDDLAATQIFHSIKLDWDNEDSYGNFDITLSGQITNPQRRPRLEIEHDFEKWTLEARVNNDPPPGRDREAPDKTAVADRDNQAPAPSNEQEPALASAAESDAAASGRTRDRTTRNTSPNGTTGASSRSEPTDRGPGSVSPSEMLPRFLTAEQLAALSKPELLAHLQAVASAKKQYRGDDETKAQIEEQWRLSRARLTEFN
jgi:hypothetical protein